MKKIFAFCLVGALLFLLFAGCTITQGDSVKKIGYVGSNTSTSWNGRFKSYDGSESKTIHAKNSQALVLTFALAAKEGKLYLTAEYPDGREIFSNRGTNVMEGTWNVAPDQNIRLRIHGEQAKNGSFQLSWLIQD